MENDLHFLRNGRHPQFFENGREHKKFLNGRQPKFVWNWMTATKKNINKIMRPETLEIKTIVVAPLRVT
jgi:hypothetical protein